MVFAYPEFVVAQRVEVFGEIQIPADLACRALVVGVIGREEYAAAKWAIKQHEFDSFFRAIFRQSFCGARGRERFEYVVGLVNRKTGNRSIGSRDFASSDWPVASLES